MDTLRKVRYHWGHWGQLTTTHILAIDGVKRGR